MIQNKLLKFLYPSGKVHRKYMNYIAWSFISNVLVSIQTVMGSHSMLTSVSNVDVDYRTMNYLGKDIIGRIGGLYFISKAWNYADKQPLRFLGISNIVQQYSFLLMSSTAFLPQEYFLPMAGTANMSSNISFVGYGAINAKCIQKLAINENIGEIYSKVTVMNTIASSIGLVIGIGICSLIPDAETRTCFIPVIGVARIVSYNNAIKDLV